MATIRKRGTKNTKAKPKRAVTKKAPSAKTSAGLDLRRELAEALEQQAATGDILRMIAKAPGDLQAVLDTMAEQAAKLCDATDAQIFQLKSADIHRVATFGDLPIALDHTPYNRQSPAGRAMVDRQRVHIRDLAAVVDRDYPVIKDYARRIGHRTTLAVPLLSDSLPIGAILIRRTEVRPFTDSQIKLLETFADQAVIAIENARLFQERETRSRDLAALHDVTAAASQSLEIKPVLDEVVKKITEIFHFDAVRIFIFDEARETLNAMASFGLDGRAAAPMTFRKGRGIQGMVAETGEPIIFEDVNTDPRYLELSQSRASQGEYCFFGIFPIKSKKRFAGTISCLGKQPRTLTTEEVRLINSMCDQIGVAVENINLFEQVKTKTAKLESSNSELREALAQQNATSEVLRVIAASPTNVQPVFDTIAHSAAQLCEAFDVMVLQVDGEVLRLVAHHGEIAGGDIPLHRGTVSGRTVIERRTIHLVDPQSETEEFPEGSALAREWGQRSTLSVPLLKENVSIGVIQARRDEIRPFSDQQINLLQTFAHQAVIAIENVRLFKELESRNHELTEALDQQTATSEVLRVISSSPTDVRPVFDAIVQSATRLCEASFGSAHRFDGQLVTIEAQYGMTPEQVEVGKRRFPTSATQGTAVGRAILDRNVVHIEDVNSDPQYVFIGDQRGLSYRTVLAVPLLKDGAPIGALGMWRREVKPFAENQINLVKTFADQAVIAIENVRLF